MNYQVPEVFFTEFLFRSLINGNLLHEQILPFIQQLHLTPTLEELKEHIPIEQAVITKDLQKWKKLFIEAVLLFGLRQIGAIRFSCRLKKERQTSGPA